MKLVCLAVFDSKVGAFLPPIFTRSSAEAVRSFASAVGDNESPFSKHCEDYTLFELGEFDDDVGKFELHSSPVSVVTAFTLKSALDKRGGNL